MFDAMFGIFGHIEELLAKIFPEIRDNVGRMDQGTVSTLADPGGAACAPRWDPILSFSHSFFPKSARVGGRRPPTGNPGSATAYQPLQTWSLGHTRTQASTKFRFWCQEMKSARLKEIPVYVFRWL